MIRLFIPLMGLLLCSAIARSQCRLDIEISGCRNDKGVIMLQLFDETRKVINQAKAAIMNKKCSIIFKEMHAGKYAVRYFHDENLSGVLETNLLGIPLEGYGFSNNVSGIFGPPPFEKWLFDLKGETKLILNPVY